MLRKKVHIAKEYCNLVTMMDRFLLRVAIQEERAVCGLTTHLLTVDLCTSCHRILHYIRQYGFVFARLRS